MNGPLGTYTFLPWLRRGIANSIDTPAGDPGVRLRASVDVSIGVDAVAKSGALPPAGVTRPVHLYGPGDIVGIDRDAIQRTDPQNWVSNFEANYLAAIEFYDEDFPWRYTPASPDGRRLLPWIALVVLEEQEEFEEGGDVTGKPLPFIEVTANLVDVMPDPTEVWAWAHVHLNRALSQTEVVFTNGGTVSGAAANAIASNPDLAYSRMLCPRKLRPSAAYHAFLLPAFESGRLAGLGIDPGPVFDDVANALTSTAPAWGSYAGRATNVPSRFPYYHRWYFRTGARGDFEHLVRLLQPKVVDSRVGRRDMDVRDPAPNVSGIDRPELGGVLRMGGALRAPLASLSPAELTEHNTFERWAQPYPQPFQSELAAFVNLADTYQAAGLGANADPQLGPEVNADPDPLITPPIYGRWHALTERLLTERDGTPRNDRENWVHELNLDPRWRVAAGLGTSVVQDRQEELMAAAWDQIGDVLEANRRIRQAQIARSASKYWHSRQLVPAAGVAASAGLTLFAPMHARVVSQAATVRHAVRNSPISTAMTSTAMRRVLRPGGRTMRNLARVGLRRRPDLLERANAGKISAAPPKATPPSLPTPDAIADATGAKSLREENQTPKSVDELPGSARFELTSPIDVFRDLRPPPVRPGETDNDVAGRFKDGLRGAYTVVQESFPLGRMADRRPLDLRMVTSDLVDATNPAVTVPRWVLSAVSIPDRIRDEIGERFVEAMAYPEFDTPMYLPLVDSGDDLFVPNLHLVEPDSITLLETNQSFIEAYMVGLNHEFARELLWREYPTDQRGSCFRQFWDPRAKLAGATDLAAARETLKDIPPLHLWPRASNLGDHDHREAERENEEELVLVIRGELLKKYPNTIITAQKARWQRRTADPTPDKSKPRQLDDDTAPMTPLYEARVEPDIYFFGFDLTIEEAAGDDTVDDEPGWFFRIEEVPGDARFGFDVEREHPAINVWNDLAWPDVVPAVSDGDLIDVSAIPSHALVEPPASDAKHLQWESDRFLSLDSAVSAAELAYISLQTPVLMAVHASELLPDA